MNISDRTEIMKRFFISKLAGNTAVLVHGIYDGCLVELCYDYTYTSNGYGALAFIINTDLFNYVGAKKNNLHENCCINIDLPGDASFADALDELDYIFLDSDTMWWYCSCYGAELYETAKLSHSEIELSEWSVLMYDN